MNVPDKLGLEARRKRIMIDIKVLQEIYAYGREKILKGEPFRFWNAGPEVGDVMLTPFHVLVFNRSSEAEMAYLNEYQENPKSLNIQIVMMAVLAKRIYQAEKELESITSAK